MKPERKLKALGLLSFQGGAAGTVDDQLAFDLGLAPLPPTSPPAPKTPASSASRPTPEPPERLPRRPPEWRNGRPVPPPQAKPVPFNYTNAMWEVVRDVVDTLPEFQHINLDKVLLSIAQAKRSGEYGTYAKCSPLRFEGGAMEEVQRGHRFRYPVIQHQGREILYVLYFVLPRFHEEQDYRGKLATVIHELYHISPHFNGDIRRFPGKNFAHGHSREVYHAAMEKMADRYLSTSPRARSHEFLKVTFTELANHPGGIVGMRVTRPRPVLVEAVSPTKKNRK